MSGERAVQTVPSVARRGLSLAPKDLLLIGDTIPHIVWLTGQHGRVEYVNRRGRDYTGLPGESHDDADWVSVVHPEDLPAVRRTWRKAFAAGTPYQRDFRLRRADGEFRWHTVRTRPVQRADGEIVGWVGTATDIEEQKLLEENLRRSERQAEETLTLLETLLSAAPVGIGFVDRELRVVRTNEVLAAFGIDSDAEQLGRPADEKGPFGLPCVAPILRQVIETGEAVLGREMRGLAGDDQRVYSWLVNGYPVRVDEEIIGAGMVLVDITARTEAEDFRSVVMANMAEGLYTVDNKGRLTSLNPAASRMLGWTEEELRGRDMHATVHFQRADGTPVPARDCPLAVVRSECRSVQVSDDTYTRKDGSTFPVSYSAAPLATGSGGGRGMVVVFRDNTEQRERQRRELEARHAQKLESLGRLTAGIAHEINTPIQFVGDNTRFLASAYQDMLELLLVYRDCLDPAAGHISWEERNKRVSEAEAKADIDYLAAEVPVAVEQSLEGIERVASLVRAMKSFSYKESNDRSYADLNEALRTTLTVARNELKYVADVTLDLGELPEVLCSLGDLNQVFLNLLVNAADALQGREQRGNIKITTRADGPMVVITISDDGCGIPPHLQQLIFEPFFTTKEVGKGTGQGLALARLVLEQHGGTIDVTSREGEGTTFELRLPVDGKRSGT